MPTGDTTVGVFSRRREERGLARLGAGARMPSRAQPPPPPASVPGAARAALAATLAAPAAAAAAVRAAVGVVEAKVTARPESSRV
jgi:hypothetical protein